MAPNLLILIVVANRILIRAYGMIEQGEKPTEEHVEKLEERLEAAQADQKNLFLIIFQRFIMILSEHLVRCDTDGMDFKSPWYMWTVGRLQQIFMMVSQKLVLAV